LLVSVPLDKMLEIMLARPVLDEGALDTGVAVAETPEETGPVIPDEIAVAPVEAGPVIPEVSVTEVAVEPRSEVTPLTTELRTEVGRIPVAVEDAGAVPVDCGTVTGSEPGTEVAGLEVAVVGAVPTAVVTPETTELKRDETGGRMPLSVGVAEAGAVDPPLPVKESPDVTLSGVPVEVGATVLLEPPRIPDGPKIMPPVLEEGAADDGTVVSLAAAVVGAITVEGAAPVDPTGTCVEAAVLGWTTLDGTPAVDPTGSKMLDKRFPELGACVEAALGAVLGWTTLDGTPAVDPTVGSRMLDNKFPWLVLCPVVLCPVLDPAELAAELELEAVGCNGFVRLPNKFPVDPALLELDPAFVPVVVPVVPGVVSNELNKSDNERELFEVDENDDCCNVEKDEVIASWEVDC
jgi:hypothetical protein